MRNINQKGFTIIELMIALFLGMLIMVAVGQVYVMSTRTAIVQQSGSSILDANVFGLQQIERNLRLAGLDLAVKSTTDTERSGIITSVNNLKGVTGFDATQVTRNDVAELPTAVNRTGSDQLTIQYRAPTDILDCEGRLALGPRKAIVYDATDTTEKGDNPVPIEGQIIVERYFLKNNGNGGLDLRCDAGRYAAERIDVYEDEASFDPDRVNAAAINKRATLNELKDFGDDGALVTANIDDFRVMLAVADANNNSIKYLTPAEYALPADNQKAIVAVKLAILARGEVPTVLNDLPDNPVFHMLGQEVQLKADTSKGYIRRVYESNSMLRNSREKK